MKAKSTFSLKDQLFNADKIAYVAGLISKAYPQFAADKFQKDTVSAFPDLELKERIAHISEQFYRHLPEDFPTALNILLKALPPELDPTKSDDDFGDFIFAPFSLFAATYGCSKTHLKTSLLGLKEITKRFSAEYAIRFFINTFPDETFTYLEKWSKDDNYHVRRLASEGTRPKLPWAQKLKIEYRRPLPLLDALYTDKTRFVTRSVANHLNDISKIDPELVITTIKRWQKSKKQSDKEMAFIAKHSLRTLVKKGHPGALDLLGFGGKPEITVSKFETTTPVVKIGDAFEFSLAFTSKKQQNLVVDYVMTFASDNAKAGKKVFKIKELELNKGDDVNLKKKHPMRLMTTRRLYTGTHQITLQVNGENFGSLEFELVT